MSTLKSKADPRHVDCPWHADGHFVDDLPLEDYPSTMLMRLAQAIQAEISSTYATAHGLSVAEWRMLAHLNAQSATQLGDLCRELAMDKAYASRLIRSLAARGLIEVHTDPDHGRRLILEITATGRALAARILPEARAAQERLLQVLEPAERIAFHASIRKLQAAIASGRHAPDPCHAPASTRSTTTRP
ncbi:MAG: MarR family transcriptional regulator [Comamonadaceae bacterium]|nr:MAG: MarR family transcriptional regulator [Comamonadaceae bacterium]